MIYVKLWQGDTAFKSKLVSRDKIWNKGRIKEAVIAYRGQFRNGLRTFTLWTKRDKGLLYATIHQRKSMDEVEIIRKCKDAYFITKIDLSILVAYDERSEFQLGY